MDDRSKTRADTALAHDDHELIDNIVPAPSEESRSGGNLQRDIATEASLERVSDPEARKGVEKQDKIDHALER